MTHPVLRLVLFIGLCLTAARLSWFALAAMWLGLIGCGLGLGSGLGRLGILLRRSRWLFVSILVFYLGFTPGEPILPAVSFWSPSVVGVEQGTRRVLVLLVIITAVSLLLRYTPRPALLAGLYGLATPLRWVGVARDRLAVRLLLTLEYAASIDKTLAQASQDHNRTNAVQEGYLAHLAAKATDAYTSVLSAGQQAELIELELPRVGRLRAVDLVSAALLGAPLAILWWFAP